MNKFFVSAGLVAIGAAAFQSAKADNATDATISPKYWSVSGTLRGFYDDNYDLTGRSSFGFEILPSVSFHVPLQQTDIGFRYTFGGYYYADRTAINSSNDPWDFTHQVDFWVSHAFNQRWRTKVSDTFVSAQEPGLLSGPNPAAPQGTPFRVNGNNISNHGNIGVDTDWTRLFSTTLSYQNAFYNYENDGAVNFGNGTIGTPPDPSAGGNGTLGPTFAGLLNRIEQDIALDLKWNYDPETIFYFGYKFSWVDFTGNEPIAVVPAVGGFNGIYTSSDRNTYTHYVYLGASHNFTPNLMANVRAGASYTDTYNDPVNPTTDWYPYADISLSYTYLPGSYVQFGFTEDVTPTDVVAPAANGTITQYANASVIYADLNHRITSRLTGMVIGRIQYNSYIGGAADANGQTSTQYSVGVNLDYMINRHLSVDAGYNYDDVTSQIPGYAYNRNRVYLGLTANY
jgi:hypothetical protein